MGCYVSPNRSSTGKRQELFFASKAEAAMVCEQLKSRRDNFGISLNALTPAKIAEAAEAYNLLEGVNISLLSAVRSFLWAHKARTASVTFLTLFDSLWTLKPIATRSICENSALRETGFQTFTSDL